MPLHAVTQSQSRCVPDGEEQHRYPSTKLFVVSVRASVVCSEQQIAETNAKSNDGLRYFQDGDNIARRIRVLQFSRELEPVRWWALEEESRQVRYPCLS